VLISGMKQNLCDTRKSVLRKCHAQVFPEFSSSQQSGAECGDAESFCQRAQAMRENVSGQGQADILL